MNIIIGGTKGLGNELSEYLSEKGEDTFVIGRSFDVNLHGAGIALDLANREDVRNFITSADNVFASSDRIFLVAGVGYFGDFSEQSEPEKMVDVNVTSLLMLAHAAWNHMTKRNGGQLVIVSSTSGVKARDKEAVYALTKHALVGFGRSLGLEVERLNLDTKVLLVLPGGMKTSFFGDYRIDGFKDFNDPSKVSKMIVDSAYDQHEPYKELMIERGSAI